MLSYLVEHQLIVLGVDTALNLWMVEVKRKKMIVSLCINLLNCCEGNTLLYITVCSAVMLHSYMCCSLGML